MKNSVFEATKSGSFSDWLAGKRHYQTPLGDLARDAARDRHFPPAGAFYVYRGHLRWGRYPACPEAMATFRRAWRLFMAALRNKGRRLDLGENPERYPSAEARLKIIPGVRQYKPEIRYWVIDECPYCGDKHTHGAGTPGEDPRDLLSHRAQHCHVWHDGHGYVLQSAEENRGELIPGRVYTAAELLEQPR